MSDMVNIIERYVEIVYMDYDIMHSCMLNFVDRENIYDLLDGCISVRH